MCRSLTLRSGLRKDAKPVMVCSADDLVEWRDFPKGLRVLLLDEDGPSAADTKLKLEEMDYIVSSFCSENDALEAISKKAESFHVAIVEVAAGKNHGGFRFLETAKDLPTIMISNSRCLSTMMKCIALGAAEFLQKPLSEDKLRNIWQHVVHRAFNAGGSVLSKSLKPIKETVVTMLRLQLDTAELEKGNLPEEEHTVKDEESDHENSVANDRLSAPSTPQLEQGGRLLVDGDCKDQPNCSTEKESADHVEGLAELRKFSCSESKSLENTSSSIGAVNIKEDGPSRPREAAVEEEVDSADGSKTDECSGVKEASVPSPHLHNGDNVASGAEDVKKKKSFPHRNSYSHGSRGDRQKMKVDWAPDLHRRFVQAVEQLGIDQAIPSKILELMKVEGLTRHNVASHLQKYRMHRRHILPKDDERRWQHHRSPMPRVYMQKPLVPFPPIHPNCGPPPSQAYPIWGHPGFHPYGVPMWSHAAFPTWQPPQETGLWKSYPEIHADAWGCPVVPPHGQFSVPSQIPPVSYRSDLFRDSRQSRDSYDLHLAEEVIDEVVKEAISKPWLPLPLGLKPPSTDTVLAELHRQGIITIPPPHSAS